MQPYQIMTVGQSGEPVLVFPDFWPDPDGLIAAAAMLRFEPMGVHYPGVRAPVPMGLVRRFVDRVAPACEQVYGAGGVEIIEAFYSLVTLPPEQLRPIQRLPHFDGVEPERLALLHFLSRDETGGTAFYRHRSTGFETVPPERLDAYREALQADVLREGLPEAAYIAGDTPIFERIGFCPARFNSAILYRSYLPHCADIPPGRSLEADPRRGRLTVNSFLMGL